MKFAIIAAGEGSRLQQEGVELPKPLVHIHGEAMIDRLIRIFRQQKAEEIVIIVNTLNPLTEQHINELKEKGTVCDLGEIEKDIIERDYRDMHRENSPLKQADDAVLLDSSDMTLKEVVDAITAMIDKKQGA